MSRVKNKNRLSPLVAATLLAMPLGTNAAEDYGSLKAEIEDLRNAVKESSEWKNTDSVVHLAGYGAFGYADQETEDGRFDQVLFAPIFHYQYRELMMLESELEIATGTDGETEVNLEYLTLDLFLNDYMTLVGGKFLSPLGQFRQNLHPSWINKLPSTPAGYGHDGAAPLADVGIQLRGGIPLGKMRTNYALYIANGPELAAEGGEIHAIESEGFTRDEDGDKVAGGRLGFLPVPKLEIGLSAATGNVAVTESTPPLPASGDPVRDYDVLGADLAFKAGNLDFRGEYIRQEVAAAAASVAAEAAEWTAWYAQAAYQFTPNKLELVARYSDFDSPHADEDQEQWAVGVNYLFASNVIAKIAYEWNDGLEGEATDQNQALFQLAYGF